MKKLLLIPVFAVLAACAKTSSTTPPPPTIPKAKPATEKITKATTHVDKASKSIIDVEDIAKKAVVEGIQAGSPEAIKLVVKVTEIKNDLGEAKTALTVALDRADTIEKDVETFKNNWVAESKDKEAVKTKLVKAETERAIAEAQRNKLRWIIGSVIGVVVLGLFIKLYTGGVFGNIRTLFKK